MTALSSYYNKRWDREDERDRPPAPTRVRIVTDAVAAAVSVKQPLILDVGCGNGWVLSAINQRLNAQARLFGVEPSLRGAGNCETRVPNATVSAGTLASVYYEEQFDIVVTSEVIEHVTDQNEFILQIAEVLKPGGTLILTTPNGLYRESYFRENPGYEAQPVENWLKISELQEMCQERYLLKSIRTFDPEYFYQRHSALSFTRALIQNLPGGQHVRCRLDRLVWRSMQRGLNILAVLERRADV